MGLCLCSHIMDDDYQMTHIQNLQRDLATVRNRIQAKKLPIVWMDGQQGSGAHSHGCNIAERFGYGYIPLDTILQAEAEQDTHRGRLIKSKSVNKKRLPDRLVIDLIKEKMIALGETRGYLINGFPMNQKQVQLFVKEIAQVDCVLLLEGQTKESEVPVIDKPSGDRKTPETARKTDMYKDLKVGSSQFDMLVEKINTNDPPADVFLKIEAAILDRLSSHVA